MKVGIRGTFSQLQAVLSGVPQGSVLGLFLFLLFINELPTWIINEIRMFADNTKLWCRIKKSQMASPFNRTLIISVDGPTYGS